MADIKAIAAELVALTVQEVIDLKNELKETYGIEPAAAAVVVAAGGEGGEGSWFYGQYEWKKRWGEEPKSNKFEGKFYKELKKLSHTKYYKTVVSKCKYFEYYVN